MVKKYYKAGLVLALALVAGLVAYVARQDKPISDVIQANVEALARNEGGGIPCGGPKNNDTGMCLSINSENCKDFYGCQ